ncbi:hypothetical protein RvY_11056 [Ramazzottius varieornatus]|uniref:Uncharacterized protein n=1 Tax=Ramazzottius varieornatus TaxID=947166 RepID=A0A1D1VNR7_RAMVA|nr:hypothetical protein RvY_11056 [Ramazzottius varieornatus]
MAYLVPWHHSFLLLGLVFVLDLPRFDGAFQPPLKPQNTEQTQAAMHIAAYATLPLPPGPLHHTIACQRTGSTGRTEGRKEGRKDEPYRDIPRKKQLAVIEPIAGFLLYLSAGLGLLIRVNQEMKLAMVSFALCNKNLPHQAMGEG